MPVQIYNSKPLYRINIESSLRNDWYFYKYKNIILTFGLIKCYFLSKSSISIKQSGLPFDEKNPRFKSLNSSLKFSKMRVLIFGKSNVATAGADWLLVIYFLASFNTDNLKISKFYKEESNQLK